MTWQVIQGDCVEAMTAMPACSVDAVVCDPPYHLTFMSKAWDHAPSPVEGQAMHKRWAREALRVLKPGGHLLAAGGSRTYHRLTAGIEDAGFEIRDCITHLYGSGFPKSHSLREIGRPELGTALKPAAEFWVVARKPLSGTVAQTVLEHGTGALNIDGCRIEHDGRGIWGNHGQHPENHRTEPGSEGTTMGAGWNVPGSTRHESGRWPANVVLSHTDECVPVGTRKVKSHNPDNKTLDEGADGEVYGDYARRSPVGHADADGTETVTAWECHPECPVRLLDEQTGELPAGVAHRTNGGGNTFGGESAKPPMADMGYGDSGGASRFMKTVGHQEEPTRFRYVAKASSAERNAGLDNPGALFKHGDTLRKIENKVGTEGVVGGALRNSHPT